MSTRPVWTSYAAICFRKCVDKTNSSTWPPQELGRNTHSAYSFGGFPKAASLNVSGSLNTASWTTFRNSFAFAKLRKNTYPMALNKHELSASMTFRTATVPSSSTSSALVVLSAALILPSSNIDASTALASNSSSSVIMPLLSLLSLSLFVGVGVGVGSSSKPLPLFLKPVASPDCFCSFTSSSFSSSSSVNFTVIVSPSEIPSVFNDSFPFVFAFETSTVLCVSPNPNRISAILCLLLL